MTQPAKTRILYLEPDKRAASVTRHALEQTCRTCEFVHATSQAEFREQLRASILGRGARFDVAMISQAVTNVDLPQTVRAVRSLSPSTTVVLTSPGTAEAAIVAAIQSGAAVMEATSDDCDSNLTHGREHAGLHLTESNQGLRQAIQQLRQSQKLATVGRLTASIAHEINNPLSAVMNIVYLLKSENLPAEAAELLRLADQELRRVVDITRQTLQFYRDAPAPLPIHIPEILDEVVGLFQRKISAGKVSVQREYRSSEPVTMLPGEVRQVLSNIFGNALDASVAGGRIRIRVRDSVHPADPAVPGVRVTIGDTGSGMSGETMRRLGQPFFTTKGQSGTGLGLWVSQGILNRYGGCMRISSARGERHGTVFALFLPCGLKPKAVSREVITAAA